MPACQQRLLARTDWGFVHQNAADGLRMDVSAGANVGERLMGLGERHYGRLRSIAAEWLERVSKLSGFKESDNRQLLPIRQLDLFSQRNKIESDTMISEALKKERIALIDKQLAEVN